MRKIPLNAPDIRLLAGAALFASAVPLSGAAAQGHCGGEYEVQPGDTLAEIAARCDSTVAGLVESNAQVSNPNRIDVGWRLTIPEALGRDEPGVDYGELDEAGQAEPAPAPAGQPDAYTVEPGDTLAGIAGAFGLTLAQLIAENEGIDPSLILPGQRIRLPGGQPPGRDVGAGPARLVLEGRVTGEGVCPTLRTAEGELWHLVSDTVNITPGEYVEVRGSRTYRTACEGRTLAVADIAEVTPPGQGRDDEGDRVRLEGRVAEGPECPVLRTPDGEVYSLVSDRVRFTPGEYVEMRGEPVEMSFCMRGTTIEVSDLREVSPPSGG